jgi:hypothetical protein
MGTMYVNIDLDNLTLLENIIDNDETENPYFEVIREERSVSLTQKEYDKMVREYKEDSNIPVEDFYSKWINNFLAGKHERGEY